MGDREAERLTSVVPSERQFLFQQLEFYAFFHFSMNTFTDREWGDGQESPEWFAPSRLDARQWVRAVKAAGMRGAILTCKHHDGFCLWPSRYTAHTVALSPCRGGNGDVVREVSEACGEEGLKFGIYLSPWDRNSEYYGQGKAYDDYYVNQLTELLTGYGEIFCVWLDGACGEGKNGKKQVYDWERYYETIRRLQPGACINVCGPDIRWCGNEAGDTRPEEWSVVPGRLSRAEMVQEKSQKEDAGDFREKKIGSGELDLGSRAALRGERDLIWYPAEVNTSIRPGWFYHESEDGSLRTLEELAGIYDRAVGGNATFLLNVPPGKDGLIAPGDVRRLAELGEYLRTRFQRNLMDCGEVEANGALPGCGPEGTRANGYESCLRFEKEQGEITVNWRERQTVSWVVIKEDIRFSQRIEKFRILDGETGGVLYGGGAVGYQKIVKLENTRVQKLRIQILESRGGAAVAFVGVY